MAIKTGIGIGAAQVYDTSGIVNAYGKLLQKQQQDQAKFQSEIADLISKVDTKGVRDQDKAEIAKMYAATKDLYAQAANTKNFQEKALLKSQIAKAVGDINEYAARSVDFSKRFNDLNNRIAQDSWAYDPKILDKLRDISSKSLLAMGADAQLDPFQFQKMPNDKSRESVFSAIKRQGEDFAKSKFVREGNREREVKIVPDEFIIKTISNKLLSNPEYRTTAIYNFKQRNPEAPVDMDAIIANETALYKSQFGTQYIGSASRIPKESKGDTIIIGGDSIQPKTFVSEDTVKIGKDRKVIKDASGNPVVVPGKPVLEFSKFVSVNPEQFSMPQLGKRFNVTAGKWEEFKPSGNVEIVGVGARAGSNAYNVVVKDKDGVEYMVTDQDLPLGIRNNKIYKAAKASVFVPRAAQPAPSPKPNSSRNKNIIVGKKDEKL